MSSYRTLFEIGKTLVAETDISKLLPLAMDQVIRQTGAERGMILVYGSEGELLCETARHLSQTDLQNPEFEISKTIIQSVRESGQYVVIKNALEEPRFRGSTSVERLRLLSVACAPLRAEGETIGVIYIDNRDLSAVFNEQSGKLLNEFAELISVAVKNAISRRRLEECQRRLQIELDESYGYGKIIGCSPAMQEVFQLIARVADTDATVLITGETGTGKELVARALHRQSPRREREFVAINCSALPESLLETELFGIEEKTATGVKRHSGFFEQAHRGTLLVDEVGDMPPNMQAKLLRVLQERSLRRVGGEQEIPIDVRLIAATHRDLPALVQQGKFREDLFYRLHVIEIKLPPLRERREDILPIAQYFLERYAKQFNRPARDLNREAAEMLLHYSFPGNVRELENIIQRAVVLCAGETIEAGDLPLAGAGVGQAVSAAPETWNYNLAKQTSIKNFDRNFLPRLLKASGGNISEAARRAGMDKKNLLQKLKQYGIKREEYK